MKAKILTAAVMALALMAVSDASPVVSRQTLRELERRFDQRIETYDAADPFYLLGSTRGVYLEAYGVVFTSEMNLVTGAVLTPFRPAFTPEQLDQLRTRKLNRLPAVRTMMRRMMVDAATALNTVPPSQQVAYGMSLFYYPWENSQELPRQVLMEAPRQVLLDFEAGRIGADAFESAVRVQEF